MARKVSWLLSLAAVLVASFGLLGPAVARAEDKQVIVDGVGTDRDSALDRALRDAVRQGVGVDIDSVQTLSASDTQESFREDMVAAASGAVTSYKVLAVTQEGGNVRVRIQATVAKAQTVRPTDVAVSDAKVIVIARQMVEGSADANLDQLKLALQEELLKRRFDVRFAVFDKAKVFDPARDLLELGVDPTQTDMVIFAESKTESLGVKRFAEYGMERQQYRTRVVVQAIRPDSLTILASKNAEATVTGRDLRKACEGSIVRALRDIQLGFIDDLVRRIIWERNNGRIFQVFLQGNEGLESDHMVRFLELVGRMPGVLKSIPRTRTRAKTLIDVLTFLGTSAFLQTLQPMMNELNLQVSGLQTQSFVLAPYAGAKGRLWADSLPQGADVLVDLAQVGTTPSLIEVTPGTHKVTFRCLGFYDTNDSFTAPRSKTTRVLAELEALPAVAPTKGTVRLATKPAGATIRNEKAQVIGTTPVEALELPMGQQLLSFSLEGYHNATQLITVEAGTKAVYEVELTKAVDLVKLFKDRLTSGTTGGLLDEAKVARGTRKPQDAVKLLQQALAGDPKCYEAFRLLGETHEYDLDDPVSALLAYNDFYVTYQRVVPEKEQRPADLGQARDAIKRVTEKVLALKAKIKGKGKAR